MADARSFGPVADQMADALQRYSKEELIDLLTHIVKTYVVEGTLPLKPEVGTQSGEEHLSGLSFPQLVLHHQMRLDHREWQSFTVSGEDVWVTAGGQRVNLTGRPSSLPVPQAPEAGEGYMEPRAGGPGRAPAAAVPAPAAAAAPADQASQPAASAAPSPPPAEPPAAPAPAPHEGQVVKEIDERTAVPELGEEIEASERFGMLEFD